MFRTAALSLLFASSMTLAILGPAARDVTLRAPHHAEFRPTGPPGILALAARAAHSHSSG
jgi:hypothetical protein